MLICLNYLCDKVVLNANGMEGTCKSNFILAVIRMIYYLLTTDLMQRGANC